MNENTKHALDRALADIVRLIRDLLFHVEATCDMVHRADFERANFDALDAQWKTKLDDARHTLVRLRMVWPANRHILSAARWPKEDIK